MKIIGIDHELQILHRDISLLDNNEAQFFLEKIKNCSIAEAYKILFYRQKYGSNFSYLYWKNPLPSSDKYIQEIAINDKWKNCILMENVIAEYLIKNHQVKFSDDWMYVGYHEFSGNRIIVGHGHGIILSRFIPDDIFNEVDATKLYVKRLGISDLKIFSTFDDLADSSTVRLDDILAFVDNDYSIVPIFMKNSSRINQFLYGVVGILFFLCAYLGYEFLTLQDEPNVAKKVISNESLTVSISSDNYQQIQELLEKLDDNLNWKQIKKFCTENQLKITQLEINKDYATIVTEITANKLKNIKDAKVDYISRSDYEELDEDKHVKVKLWIKLNQ